MREDGKTIQEIADFYGLSHRHAYTLIRQLAEELNIPYDSMLYRPHRTHIYLGSGKVVEPAQPVDFSDFEREFREAISSFDKTLYQMNKILQEWPEMPANLEEV